MAAGTSLAGVSSAKRQPVDIEFAVE